MPVYKLVSKEMLSIWLVDLKKRIEELMNTPNVSILLLLVLELYEYTQCYCMLTLSGKDIVENKKVSVSDIKRLIVEEKYVSFINYLRGVRNDICHGDSGKVVDDIILKFITNRDILAV